MYYGLKYGIKAIKKYYRNKRVIKEWRIFSQNYDEIHEKELDFLDNLEVESNFLFNLEKKIEIEKERIKKESETIENYEEEILKQRSRYIPAKVRYEVYMRDQGKCVICGSKKNIQFDHIIPFEKGGAHSFQNIQLLCQSCNLKKSNRLDV